ncbi:NAD(P)H-dependent oxidoreductase [Gordonia aurantiaca]|uniref:NAD(P)H-dependent oxidoreductase n=1 Tax=Gordonia sp. B21 TaxID=3151852 RepID=UPI0032642288
MRDNALWVLAHPDAASLSGHLRDVGVSALRDNGWEVVESDMYRMRWDPLLFTGDTDGERAAQVRAEQRKLRDADLVVLQFPLWWDGMPAILKGWVDRVFESGFAYHVPDPATGRMLKYGRGGLEGRRALAVVTAGDRAGSLTPRGISGSIDDVLWPLLHGPSGTRACCRSGRIWSPMPTPSTPSTPPTSTARSWTGSHASRTRTRSSTCR